MLMAVGIMGRLMMKIFRKRRYCYLLAYTFKGGEGCMTVNLEHKIKTVDDIKELKKYIEDTTECANVGIKNFILMGRC